MEEIIYKLVFQVTYQTLKPLLAFLHHDSFLYWPFILSTLLIAMLAWRFTRARGDLDPAKPHWKEFFDHYLSRRLWWHAGCTVRCALVPGGPGVHGTVFHRLRFRLLCRAQPAA